MNEKPPNQFAALEPYATEPQRRVLRALAEHGTQRAAAKALGMHHANVAHLLGRVRRAAARKGYSPSEDSAGLAADGYHVRGKSTLYDGDGKVRAQWVKTNEDAQRLEDVARLIVENLNIPAAKPIALEHVGHLANQMTVYPIGDAHIGLLSWGAETGEDHDLAIAQRDLTRVACQLVSLAPATRRALVVNVGDFFHTDNYAGVTERGGNRLDCDSRYPKMVRVGVACMLSIITCALAKHEEVEVINAAGNHDRQTSLLLAMLLEQHYRNDPRVIVRSEPRAFHYVEFGKCLVGVTHGDKCKPATLPEIMATDESQAWGRTQHRFWYTGHVHHDQVKDFRGCRFESFRTLARSDAWHYESGYRSGKDMKCIVLDAERGEVLRHTVGLTASGDSSST